MLTLAAAAAFLLGAIFQAVNGPDLTKATAWPFWLFVGLCAWAFQAVLGAGLSLPTRRRRR
jgi:ABC-type branched-subunit amino acid transport system permease subunit